MKRRRSPTDRERDGDLFAPMTPSLFRWQPPAHTGAEPSEPPERGSGVEGPADADPCEEEEAGEVPAMLALHTVLGYVTVCVKLTGIVAASPREAARSAQEQFRWEEHVHAVEFVDELHELLVDVDDDPDYSQVGGLHRRPGASPVTSSVTDEGSCRCRRSVPACCDDRCLRKKVESWPRPTRPRGGGKSSGRRGRRSA